jgi:hypothetical protein
MSFLSEPEFKGCVGQPRLMVSRNGRLCDYCIVGNTTCLPGASAIRVGAMRHRLKMDDPMRNATRYSITQRLHLLRALVRR